MARKKKYDLKTKEKREALKKQAKRLMTAKVNPLSTKQCAAALRVSPHWVRYNVGCARNLRIEAECREGL